MWYIWFSFMFIAGSIVTATIGIDRNEFMLAMKIAGGAMFAALLAADCVRSDVDESWSDWPESWEKTACKIRLRHLVFGEAGLISGIIAAASYAGEEKIFFAILAGLVGPIYGAGWLMLIICGIVIVFGLGWIIKTGCSAICHWSCQRKQRSDNRT